ncbi:MAG: hypothetical protein CMA59_00140 [Euryarchaeota archaeon]|jgi:leucyl aminopeptidase (aminopeptidase T)|nr:hypothetical protein [Euryarchaeota archaeon]|tara:strand:- start:1842 stop:2183 length:342 start_codon:yes stop_codon:yes gene_type:complete
MTCGLHTDFNAATAAVKKAFKAALDADTLEENQLAEVWRHYQGLKSIAKSLPEHTHITFGTDTTDINFDTESLNLTGSDGTELNFNLAADTVPVAYGGSGVPGGAGSDVITFT